MANSAVESAISVLANTMRLYVESHMRFAELFRVDREEAVNNLDRAFEAKLEAFHTLYDVSKRRFRYFDYADTTLLIAVRNAIHHRDHPLFRSLYSRIFLDDPLPWAGTSFLLVSYPTRHAAPIRMNHYVRLDDLDARLNPKIRSQHLDAVMSPNKAERRFAMIEDQLGLDVIRLRGSSQRFPDDQIYLDMMSIFTSAVCRVFKAMNSAGVVFKGFDAKTYMEPFTSEIDVDLSHPIFKVLRIEGDVRN